ncbi:unnamed protein product [Clonostachys solani]|uniref:Carrier domain-containing protein n=1 Tax=Clonostachys solani TaxID=160281 RepID=A0A9N9ZKT2_9HYPO|nr:unnamed protein product [Clonostachys solani]
MKSTMMAAPSDGACVPIWQDTDVAYWQKELTGCESDTTIYPSLNQSEMTDVSVQQHKHAFTFNPRCPDTAITTPTLVRAAWALVAGCMTNSDDVTFGVTVSSHNLATSPAMLPARIKLSRHQTVSRYLCSVQNQIAEMGQHCPPCLQQISGINPGAAHACMFQTLLGVETGEDAGSRKLSGFGSGQSQPGTQHPGLEIMVQISGSSITTTACYNTAMIELQDLEALLIRLEHVMHQLDQVSHTQELARISIISSHDLGRIWEWNREVPSTIKRCLHEMIEETIQSQPDYPAVCAWDGDFTYRELGSLATALAAQLISKYGLGSGSVIPICFEKSKWTIVAILAVLKTGNGFILLDSNLPEQRLEAITQQVNPALIVSSPSNESLCLQLCSTVVSLSAEINPVDIAELECAFPTVSPDSIVWMVFTSGSTGTPKGVLISHQNVASSLHHQQPGFGIDKSSRVYDFSSYGFDMSHCFAFQALVCGGCVCVPNDADRRNDLAAKQVPMIKSMVIGGEAIRISDAETWFGKTKLTNAYGPSECTPVSLLNISSSPEDALLIGRGIGQNTWIVDPANDSILLPPGAIGELLLEGPLVGAGYLHNKEKTAASFIQDPSWLLEGCSKTPGRRGRIYKTGDLVRYRTDGILEYIARKDAQVKIRGQRVELEEVEHHVQRWVPDVSLAAADVVVLQGEGSSPMLAAFVQKFKVGEGAEGVNEAPGTGVELLPVSRDVEDKLAQNLPIYMVPRVFFLISRIPMTPSGKTDRKLLREIAAGFSIEQLVSMRGKFQGSKRQPTSELEKEIRTILARVLRIPEAMIGMDDSFFHLGGDSISAITVVGQAREAGIKLSVGEILGHPVVCDFVAQCVRITDGSSESIRPFSLLGADIDTSSFLERVSSHYRLNRASICDAYPCTPLQEGIVTLALQREGDYIAQHVLEVGSNIAIEDLCQAWDTVSFNNPILRTRVVEDSDGGLVQIVLKEIIQWIRSDNLEEYLTMDKSLPMGLGDRFARYAIVKDNDPSGAPKRWLVWTVHHALVDGWSFELVMDELRRSCQGEPKKTSARFSAFLKYISEKKEDEVSRYWKETLADNDCIPFPVLPSPLHESAADGWLEYAFSRPKLDNMDITMSTLVRAAWALIVGQMTGSDDVVFGVTVSGRNAPVDGIDSMVAPTFATVPLRVNLTRSQSASEYLEAVQMQATDMIPFEQAGMHRIAKLSSSCHKACQFQTLLVIQPPRASRATQMYGTWREDQTQQKEQNKYPFLLQVHLGTDTITTEVYFDSDVIKPWVVSNLLQRMDYVMQQLCSDSISHTKVEDIVLITPKELDLVWQRNRHVPELIESCIHDKIHQVAIAQPYASAIEVWDGKLTYNDLDSLSEALASQLIDSGVRPGMVVPMCMEKSRWAIVTMLGILRAGAAFVFLDPNAPQERLENIVKQVDADIILCSPLNLTLCSGLASQVVVVESTLWKAVLNRQSDVHLPVTSSSSTMYVIFTSGSTGAPKGVMISHQSFLTALSHQEKVVGIKSQARVYDFTSYTFDVSLYYLFATLGIGGCLCVPDEHSRRYQLTETITSFRADTVFLTPSVVRLIRPEQTPSLQLLVVCGEAVQLKDIEPWWGKMRLMNGYGPSECTPFTVFNESSNNVRDILSIGRGVGAITWVVDPNDHNILLPLGATGELLLEGPLIGIGYINNEEKTAAAFIQDPVWLLQGNSSHPGRRGRLYKTGDLVRYNEDGTLLCLGRKDGQIKIRGQRVETGEVEHWVQNYMKQEASQAVVELLTSQGGEGSSNPVLAAFLQMDKKQLQATGICDSPEASLLRIHAEMERKLAQHLPTYMIPTAFFGMRELPLTVSRKTDRKRLREIGASIFYSTEAEQHVPSAEIYAVGDSAQITESEELAYALAEKISTMLPAWHKKSDSSSNAKVFDDLLLQSCGIDSVNMMSLSYFISQTFNVRVPMRLFMDPSTSVRSLSRAVSDLQGDAAVVDDSTTINNTPSTPGTEYSIHTGLDLTEEINLLDSRIAEAQSRQSTQSGTDAMPSNNLTVLLTGATGYIGTQILRQLLEHRQVSSVITIARGVSDDDARNRVVDSAVKALWWTDFHQEKLAVWPGDLSLSRLGLGDTQWATMSDGSSIDIIIHNGAVVHWGKSYEELKATNVTSTIDLLELAVLSQRTRFLYVTGGREKTSNDEQEEDIVRELSSADALGYSQAKYVAEAVVKRAALRRKSTEPANIAIVCPGRVIGTTSEGVPNADDYLWRLVAGCVKAGSYNEDMADAWVEVADVTTVASTIIQTAFNPACATGGLRLVDDGIHWGQFWSLLRGIGYRLEGQRTAEWLQAVRKDVEADRESHVLWPVMHILEAENANRYEVVDMEPNAELSRNTPLTLKVAVAKNIEFLVDVGFLPQPPSSSRNLKRNLIREAFSRSSYKLEQLSRQLPIPAAPLGMH